jgi:arylsulfatase A-like enzyme
MLHVLLPHQPWVMSPEGTTLPDPPPMVPAKDDPTYDWIARQQYQLHAMQVGAADQAIGHLIDHLDEEGIWDDTTVVVASDHGMGVTTPDFGRDPTAANTQELFRTAMFIHAPGQTEGKVDDQPALSIDLLPTLVDLLHIETDWTFDGHSLVDGSEGTVEPLVGTDFAPALDVVARHHEDFPLGDSWDALAAVDDHGDLIGRAVTELPAAAASDLTLKIDHAEDLADLPTEAGEAPRLLTGTIAGGDEPPPELLISVNGRLAGVAGGYKRDGDAWSFTAFLAPYFRDGANDVRAYVVLDRSDGPALARLG